MKKYETVKLIYDVGVLKEKGIIKGMIGILISQIASSPQWIVMFFNPKNEGDYAVSTVSENNLSPLGSLPDIIVEKIEEIANRPDFFKHSYFSPTCFKEYDMVELIVNKPEYQKNGVKKGMRGCVMSKHAIKGRWQVIFSENSTGRDIADIMVKDEDLILID